MLKRNLRRLGSSGILCSILFVAVVAGQGIPQGSASTDTGLGGVNTISGTVLAATGQRMERRISIRLRSMMSGDRITTSDEYGNFVFRGIPSGDYAIVIDKEKEFEPFTQVVSIIQPRGMPPQTYPLSIRLKTKVDPSAKPGVIAAEFADVPKDALESFKKAGELGKAGDHAGSIKQLKVATEEYPQFMQAYNEMGVQYLKLNDPEKADEAFSAALKINPDAYAPLMNHGIATFQLKKFSEAEAVFRQVLKSNEKSAVAHYFLGQSLANLGKFVDAEKELLTAIKLGGEEMKEAHRLLAIIYSSSGDKTGAAEELETYLKLAPNTPDAEQLRKVILQLKGVAAPATSPNTKPSP